MQGEIKKTKTKKKNKKTKKTSADTSGASLVRLKMILVELILIEPAHDKTYNKTCVTSKDSDQPVHTPSMARVLVYPSLKSLEPVEGTCDQRRSDQTVRVRRLI